MVDQSGPKSRMETNMKASVVFCEWKEQLDLGELNSALKSVFNGKDCPAITEVESGGDVFVVVVSEKEISEADAQELYNELAEYGN
jgi:hypothetical protein